MLKMTNLKIASTPVKSGVVKPLKHRSNTSIPCPVMQLHLPNQFTNPSSSISLPPMFSSIKPMRKPRSSPSQGLNRDAPSTFRHPPMQRKPRWYWRLLSSIPYLMPVHQSWVYCETAYHIHPFLEDFEFFTYPFLKAIGSRLPTWFFMAYFFLAYLLVVRRKEWPHFFRFHVIMGMLLEISLQAVGVTWRFLPRSVYWGKIGMHFWVAFTFGYLFTVIECVFCALSGIYADVPFFSDAAYAQIPYD